MGAPEDDLHARFDAIVAGWDTTADDPVVEPPVEPPVEPAVEPADDAPVGSDDTVSTGDTDNTVSTGDTDSTDTTEKADDTPSAGGPLKGSTNVPWRASAPQHSIADAVFQDGPSSRDDEDEEHWAPPAPAPLPPQEDLHFWGALIGLTTGPLLLLWLVIARPEVSGWWTWIALGLTVGGMALVVLRQPPERHDDPDHGARV
ncbi:hypothetical protein [Janibacter sp. G56]|uniref:hypothetical protein n=1 Tax=Janibacter sp. G56 TaxID=3418717 RepID=UPI003CFF9D06